MKKQKVLFNYKKINRQIFVDTFFPLAIFFITILIVFLYKEFLLSIGLVDVILLLVAVVWLGSFLAKKVIMKIENNNKWEFKYFCKGSLTDRAAHKIVRVMELVLAPIMAGVVMGGIFLLMGSK